MKVIKMKDKLQASTVEKFKISILHLDGTVDEVKDIITINPTSEGLLVLVLSTFETIVYPIAGNIKKYTFSKYAEKGVDDGSFC